jgi:hypothetical protein
MRIQLLTGVAVLVGALAWCGAPARASGGRDEGGAFHFDIGLGGVTGMDRVDRANREEFDQLQSEDASTANGGDGGPLWRRSDEMPVGPMFNAYYLFDFGLGLGGGIGPMTVGDMRIHDEAAAADTFHRDEFDYVIVPVGLDARYEFLNHSGVIPYVRGGFRYPLAGVFNSNRQHWDDDSGRQEEFGGISDRHLGAFAAVGIEFPRAHFGMEAAYDSSRLTVNNSFRSPGGTTFMSHSESVEPDQFMFSVFFHF